MSSKTKAIYKRNKKLNVIYHPDSNLVIKSAKEKLVIGRIEDGEFIELDEKALDLCEEYGFSWDESLVEAADSDDEEEPTEEEPAEEPQESPTEEEPTEVEPTEVEPTEVEPTEVESQEESQVSPSEEPTEEPVEEPSGEQPTEVEPTEEEPAEEKSQDMSSRDNPVLENLVNGILSGIANVDGFCREILNDSVRRGKVEKDLQKRLNNAQEEVRTLKEERDTLLQELEVTKKKLKGVLLAMQGDL